MNQPTNSNASIPAVTAGDGAPPSPPKRRGARTWLIAGAVLLACLAILLALVPMIAGKLAPGIIQSQAAKFVRGTVKAESASFSWGGPQRIGPVTWTDENGAQVARASVQTSAGFFSLATGSKDLGDVVIENAAAHIERAADGSLNVQKLLVQQPAAAPTGAAKPAPGAPAQPFKLPEGLKVKLSIKQLDAEFVDNAVGVMGKGILPDNKAIPLIVGLNDISVDATLDPTKPLLLVLRATAQQKGVGVGDVFVNPGAAGHLTIDAQATNWASKSGEVTPDKATIRANVDIKDFPTAIVDAVLGPIVKDDAGAPVPLARALGSAATITINANGSFKDATAKFNAALPRLSATGDLRMADNTLTTASPVTIHAHADALRDLIPALARAASGGNAAQITTFPDATCTLDALHVALPVDGKPLSLRGAGAKVDVLLGEVSGTVALGAGQSPQPMRIAPLHASIDAPDLAGTVRITGATNATLAGQSAGDVAIDLSLGELLDSAGALKGGIPSSMSGSATIRKVSTAIAQPFVQALGLDLPRDVGPTLDADLTAASAGKDTTDITLNATAQFLRAAGGLTISPSSIVTKSSDFTINLARGAAIAGLFVKPETGVRIDPQGAGPATLTIRALSIPRAGDGSLRLSEVGGSVSSSLDGLRIVSAQGGAPIELTTLKVGAQLAPGKECKANIDGTGSHAGQQFEVKGYLNTNYPLKRDSQGGVANSLDVPALRPEGRLQVTNLPTMIVQLMPRSEPAPASTSETPAAPPLNVAGLLQGIFGDRVGLDVGIKKTESADVTELVFRANGGKSSLVTRARVSATEVKGTENYAALQLTPQAFTTLLQSLSPEHARTLTLAQPAEVQVSLANYTLPMRDSVPQYASAEPLKIKVAVPARAVVRGLGDVLGGSMKTLSSAGIEGLVLDVTLPWGALVPAKLAPAGIAEKRMPVGDTHAVLTAKLLANDQRVGDLQADVKTLFQVGSAIGPAQVSMTLASIATSALEDALGQHGLLTSALGDTAQIVATGSVDPTSKINTLEVTATAPKLKADGPIALRTSPQAIEVTKASRLALTIDPAWATGFLKPADVSSSAQPAAFTFTQPMEARVAIEKFTLPLAEGGPPLAASVRAEVPTILAKTADNQPVQLDGTVCSITTAPGAQSSPTLNVGLTIASAKAGQGEAAKDLGITGVVENLVSAKGAIDPANATLSAKGKLPAIPTALLDAIARKDGLLVEALGPMIALEVDAQRVSLKPRDASAQPGTASNAAPGHLLVRASSDRATFVIDGDVQDAVFTTTQPVNLSILELSEALAGRVVKGLPAIGTIQKLRTDAPAMITAQRMTIPLSNDLTKLNGVINIDPGEARFGTSQVFGQLLDLAKVRTSGTLGQKLEPLQVTVTNGVATYPKYRVPLGEFSLESEGEVNLAQRQVNVVTWVPIGALTDAAAGLFKQGGLSAILGTGAAQDAAALLPFRTKGSFDSPSTGPDLELYGKTIIKQVAPEKLIEKGLQDIFKKKPKDPAPTTPPAGPK